MKCQKNHIWVCLNCVNCWHHTSYLSFVCTSKTSGQKVTKQNKNNPIDLKNLYQIYQIKASFPRNQKHKFIAVSIASSHIRCNLLAGPCMHASFRVRVPCCRNEKRKTILHILPSESLLTLGWYLWHWGGTCWCHGGGQSGPAPPPGPWSPLTGPWSPLTPKKVILSRAPSPPLPHLLLIPPNSHPLEQQGSIAEQQQHLFTCFPAVYWHTRVGAVARALLSTVGRELSRARLSRAQILLRLWPSGGAL